MILISGENVIDLIGSHDGLLRPTCGGGPANTAVALARRGIHTALVGAVGNDAFGDGVERRHQHNGVNRTWLKRLDRPSTLALATLDDAGKARYDFWTEGTADFAWNDKELPEADPKRYDALHFGSLAAYIEPSATEIEKWVNRSRRSIPISFDPNIRLEAMGERTAVRKRTEKLVALSHIVRASDDDIEALYPGEQINAVAQRWLDSGPELVVVTLGQAGCVALHRNYTLSMPAKSVEVVDTIGAGDAFTSGLLGWLTTSDWMRLDRKAAWGNRNLMAKALDNAARQAAAAVRRAGAP
ncbi:carbohydrate kinase family protein [Haloglycomyces albus]|uniref:carbohydrate kinase family protein n=1 Tax=Haloglycomyces albus TaxID=526067 RepID=UPI00046D3965|nr:carbohydrate kinase [Haloglycomyces albus]